MRVRDSNILERERERERERKGFDRLEKKTKRAWKFNRVYWMRFW